jgi:predicted RNA-binding protein with PIN domain
LIVLIDGTNALRALGIDAGGYEADRGTLLADVRSRTRKGFVFFDGWPPPGEFAESEARGVRVVFSKGREADEAIVDAVRDADDPRRVVVVTDDLPLGRRASQLGARQMRVREFFAARAPAEEAEATREDEVAHPSDAGGLSDAEIAEMERRLTAERRTPGTRPTRRTRRPPRSG